MPLDGDFSKLQALVHRLDDSKKHIVPELTQALIPDAKRLVGAAFREEADPQGSTWAPNKDGSESRLSKLRKLVSYEADDQSLTISIPPPLSYHQKGTSHLPARSVVPFGDLPGKWTKSFDDEAKKIVKKQIKGQ